MTRQSIPPIAFFSWAHTGDDYFDASIHRLKDKIESEVRLQSGRRDFKIFIDRDKDSIGWGQQWEKRINGGIDNSTFLISLLTPLYFTSKPCFEEWKRFKLREKELGREDLILSLLYVNSEVLNSPKECEWPEWPIDIAARQYRRFDHMRFAAESSSTYQEAVASLATEICKSWEVKASSFQHIEIEVAPSNTNSEVLDSDVENALPAQSFDVGKSITSQQENRSFARFNTTVVTGIGEWQRRNQVIVVDASDASTGNSISDAIFKANPGDTILVRPGVYNEQVVVNKRISIVGDGNVDEIIVCYQGGKKGPTVKVLSQAVSVEIKNIKVEGRPDLDSGHCILVECGRIAIESCRISYGDTGLSMKASYVEIKNCYIHDCHTGISITKALSCNILKTWIEGSRSNGIYFWSSQNCVIKDSLLNDNNGYGVHIMNTKPKIERTQFHHNTSGEIG